MRAAYRDAYVFDAISRTSHTHFSGLRPFPHFVLAESIYELFRADRAEKTNRQKQSFYVSDMRLFDDHCEILFGFSDTLAADPTLTNREKRTRRVITKRVGEGVDHSAHVYWKYRNRSNATTSRFILESAYALHSGVISRLVNGFIRAQGFISGRFHLDDPTGVIDRNTGVCRKIKARPHIELVGHPSAEFIRDLTAGELSEIELYTEASQQTPWDQHGYVIEEHRSLLLKPNKKKLLAKAKALIDGIRGSAKKDYEFARIAFKTEAGVPRSVRVMSANFHLVGGNNYVKKVRMEGLGASLPNSFDSLNDQIISEMAKHA